MWVVMNDMGVGLLFVMMLGMVYLGVFGWKCTGECCVPVWLMKLVSWVTVLSGLMLVALVIVGSIVKTVQWVQGW